MKYFDKEASKWDENPIYIERAKVISDEILKSIKVSNNINALEYGCGTGLLSFFLYKSLKSIVLMDDSSEMLKIVNNKIKQNKIKNMKTVKINLIYNRYANKHDLIYTLMTLHHIKNTEKIIEIFYSLLNKNGYLCIADLIEEDGSFHKHHKNYNGHNGFNTEKLKKLLECKGFSDVKYSICYEMEKKIDQNIIRKYPIFLMIGEK
ncbi:MAG: methyltransferase domain-containing protein [Elusimicrobiota bacterium]